MKWSCMLLKQKYKPQTVWQNMIMQSNTIFIVTKEKLMYLQDIHISASKAASESRKWQKITDITTTVIGGPTKTKTTDYKDKISNPKIS